MLTKLLALDGITVGALRHRAKDCWPRGGPQGEGVWTSAV